jgi:PPOX class probable F420-dependent enzyme
MPATTTLDSLGAATYISLTTFRKNGDPVATPVWVVREGDSLFVITEDNSGKIKRLRNNPAVLLAPCDVRGRVEGDTVSGIAHLAAPERVADMRKLLAAKYRVTYRVMMLGDRVRRGHNRENRVVIEIAVNE